MTCNEALALMSAGLDSELSPEEEAALQAHLAGCAECSRLMGELRGLDEQLAGLREPAPEGLKRGVLYRIDQASGKAKKPARRWFGPGTALGAVAAVLVLLVGLGVVPLNGPKLSAPDAAKSDAPAKPAEVSLAPEAQEGAEESQQDYYYAPLEPSLSTGGSQSGEAPTKAAVPSAPEPGAESVNQAPTDSTDGNNGRQPLGSPLPVTEALRERCDALSVSEDAAVLLYTEFDRESLLSLLEAEQAELYARLAASEPTTLDGLLVCRTDCGTALALHEWLLEQLPPAAGREAADAESRLTERMERLDPGSESLRRVLRWNASGRSVRWPLAWAQGWADRFRAEENWALFFPEETYTPNAEKTAYLVFVH